MTNAKDLVLSFTKTATLTKGTSLRTKPKAKVLTSGPTAKSSKVSGNFQKSMGSASGRVQMATAMPASGKRIRLKATGYTYGPTETGMKESGGKA